MNVVFSILSAIPFLFFVVFVLIAFSNATKTKGKKNNNFGNADYRSRQKQTYAKPSKRSAADFERQYEQRLRSDSGEMMHRDHYRRERRPLRYSADPCAYSENYSWRRSKNPAYDDPWDM